MTILGRLSGRDRRALLWGAAAVVPALFFAGVVRPYASMLAEARERLAAEESLLARERDLLTSYRVRAGETEARRAVALAHRRLFEERSDLLAASSASAYVQGLARLSGLVLSSEESGTPDSSAAGVRGYPLEIRGEGDVRSLMTFLRLVENGQPLLRVDRLTVESARGAPPLPSARFGGYGAGAGQSTGAISFAASLTGFGRPTRGDDQDARADRLAAGAADDGSRP